MKIPTLPDASNFIITPTIIGGDFCILVNPRHSGAVWTKDNLILRSSIWTENGELVSASFPKFFNWDESTDINPTPSDGEAIEVEEKLDGSTLIVSKYQGELIIRTRGSVGYDQMGCADEMGLFHQKYASFFEMMEGINTCRYSYIFEWVSPKNKIVVHYEEPELVLTNIINHNDYSLESDSSALDACAARFGFRRPRSFKFSSIDELLSIHSEDLTKFGITDSMFEGMCVYYNNRQTIKKVKTKKYLICHKFKEKCDFENLLDIYLSADFKHKNDFYNHIVASYDFECAEMAKPEIDEIFRRREIVLNTLNELKTFLMEEVIPLPTRREQAQKTISKYSGSIYTSLIFTMLDKKEIQTTQMRNLYTKIFN